MNKLIQKKKEKIAHKIKHSSEAFGMSKKDWSKGADDFLKRRNAWNDRVKDFHK